MGLGSACHLEADPADKDGRHAYNLAVRGADQWGSANRQSRPLLLGLISSARHRSSVGQARTVEDRDNRASCRERGGVNEDESSDSRRGWRLTRRAFPGFPLTRSRLRRESASPARGEAGGPRPRHSAQKRPTQIGCDGLPPSNSTQIGVPAGGMWRSSRREPV
jgi:hypothetical protein